MAAEMERQDVSEPRTEAGRALLAREAYNSRSFALITSEAIRAIEDEAADDAKKETAEFYSSLVAEAFENGKAAERDRLRNEVVNIERRFLDNEDGGYASLRAVMDLLDEDDGETPVRHIPEDNDA